jgi:hypothetical protein
MPRGQGLLDLRLTRPEPVHGGVEILRLYRSEPEHFSQCGDRALGIQRTGGGELGVRSEHARGDERNRAITLRTATRREQAVDPELLERAEHGGDMAVGARAGDVEDVGGGHEGLAAERAADEVDDRIGQMREVAQRLVLDLARVAVGASQQVGLVDAALVAARRSDDVNN